MHQLMCSQERSPTGEIDSKTLNSTCEVLGNHGLRGMKSPETHSGTLAD